MPPPKLLASPRLTEDRVEGVLSSPSGLVTWHLTVRLDAAFQGTELPVAVVDPDPCLAGADAREPASVKYFTEILHIGPKGLAGHLV